MIVCVIVSSILLISTCLGGEDVEDWISRGYTCSLADSNSRMEMSKKPGVEIVCDDGVCSQCVKTGEGMKPWMMRQHKDIDPEDYLRHGYVCSEEYREHGDAERVCDDGHCVGCKKPHWSGGRGDVERFLQRGHTCFLVRDVPQYALSADVEVVCEDGDCFGCIHRQGAEPHQRNQRPLTLDDMIGHGWTCVLTNQRGSGVTCEDGKCFQCSPPVGQDREYPVSVRFLDQAEDFVDNNKWLDCGLQLRTDPPLCHEAVGDCEGELCVRCCPPRTFKAPLQEHVLDRVEDLAKSGRQCFVKFGSNVQETSGELVVCSGNVCFVCRR